jgi:hypothetical protein
MSLESSLGNFFKAEIKAAGRRLLDEEKIAITGGSDSTIKVYVRASPPVAVLLTSSGVGSRTLTAECSCTAAKKAQFCKHVWGALLGAEEKFPDFLVEKRAIEKSEAGSTRGGDFDSAPTDSYAETAKARASEYRKDQYQKQKARVKATQLEKSGKSTKLRSALPADVEAAVAYFTLNGFPMADDLDEDTLAEAKRSLSRVFHPDKGGTHDETVELNRNCEILQRFLRG